MRKMIKSEQQRELTIQETEIVGGALRWRDLGSSNNVYYGSGYSTVDLAFMSARGMNTFDIVWQNAIYDATR